MLLGCGKEGERNYYKFEITSERERSENDKVQQSVTPQISILNNEN